MDHLPYLFLFFFPLFWMGVCWTLGGLSGWRAVHKHYGPAPKSELLQHHRMTSGMMRGVRYKGSLNVGADAQGLYLSLVIPFRIGHPRLFIPWSAFREVEHRGSGYNSAVRAEIGSPKLTTVVLPLKLVRGTPLAFELPGAKVSDR